MAIRYVRGRTISVTRMRRVHGREATHVATREHSGAFDRILTAHLQRRSGAFAHFGENQCRVRAQLRRTARDRIRCIRATSHRDAKIFVEG